MLEVIGVDLDVYMNALQMLMKGTTLILKHNIQDAFINGVNSDYTKFMGRKHGSAIGC